MKVLSLGVLLSMTAQPAPMPAASPSAAACISVAALVSPASFRRYPADAGVRGPWQIPDVRSGIAHLYRSVVRSEGIGPPDFAGRYKVVRLGCGAGLTCPLFVDLKTGGVVFAPALRSVEQPYDIADLPGFDDLRLVYRADSRLLVAVGARNEQSQLEGATLFEMRKDRLRLIRLIPNKALCRDGPGLGSEQ